MRDSEHARYAAWWIEIAVGDLATAQAIVEKGDLPLRNAAHLAQQTAEKALKAAIAFHGDEPPRVHDLLALVRRLPPSVGLGDLGSDLVALGDAAIHGRYPQPEDPPYQRVEVERLVGDAALLLAAVLEYLEGHGLDVHDESAESRFGGMPGWELVSVGLADRAAGRETVAALLVACASERLSQMGLDVTGQPMADVTGRLYALVQAEVGPARAHSRYNALRRRLASFLRSADATAA